MARVSEWFRNPVNRRWVYGVVLAGAPLLVLAGLVSDTEVAQWTNLAAAVLGFSGASLAFPNTPTSVEQKADYAEELAEAGLDD